MIDWNNEMLDAIRATSLNPPRATRIFAITQIAVFDAVNGIVLGGGGRGGPGAGAVRNQQGLASGRALADHVLKKLLKPRGPKK